MQKVVSFLEKHVQWVALGLGALYLLYMVWSYLIVRPVTIAVSGAPEELTPGTIDQYILENRITELESQMAAPKPVEFKVPDFSAQMAQNLSGGTAPALEGRFVFSRPAKMSVQLRRTGEDGTPGEGDGTKVAGLPTPPAPVITDQGAGRSLVVEAMQRGGAAAARQPAAAANNRNEGGRARAGGNARGNETAQGRDQDWVSVFYSIPVQALADEYDKVGIKEDLYGTIILDVELIREKQLADGTWGEQTVVKDPEYLNVPEFPDSGKAQQMAYADWAAKNVLTVVQPPFLQVTKGDQWPPVQLVDEKVDENMLRKREQLKQRRLEERKRQQEQQRRLQQQRRPANNRRQPGRMGPGGGMPGGGMMFAPRDNSRPAARRPAAAQPAQQPMMPGMMMDPMMGGMPGMMPGMMPPGMDLPGMMPGGAQPGRQLNNRFRAPGLPPGEFDPSQLEEDIQGWVHDTNVEPGAVYRYQVRYKIRNPLFDMRGMVADPKLAEQFAIESLPSGWSDEIEIEPLSRFYLASGMLPDGQVRFEVLRSTGGEWISESFEVSPGDVVGENRDEVDFSTGWTLVTLHTNPRTREVEVYLVDDEGNMQTRQYSTDQNDPTYKDLKQEIADAEAARTRTRASAR